MDTLRAGVPVGHAPIRIKHEDRIVGDALNKQPESPFALCERSLGCATLGDVVLERGFNAISLLDLGVESIVGLAQFDRALVDAPLQVVVGATQSLFRETTGRDVLRDHDEITDRAAGIENRRDTVLDPHARAARQHVTNFGDELPSRMDRLSEQFEHLRLIIGVDNVLDVLPQQIVSRSLNDLAESVVEKSVNRPFVSIREMPTIA